MTDQKGHRSGGSDPEEPGRRQADEARGHEVSGTQVLAEAAEPIERRNFLKKGLGAAGAAALAGGAFVSLRSAPGSGAEALPAGLPRVPVLTADGHVVEVSTSGSRRPGRPAADPAVRRGDPGRKWVMVIDLANCDGCGHCADACNAMHHLSGDQPLLRIYRMQDAPEAASYWFPRTCFHCDDPPCCKVCPVDATFKREDGIVLVDNERCIGCRFCMAACPFSARVFIWAPPEKHDAHRHVAYSPETGHPPRVGTVMKCDFCPEMTRDGELPYCVTGCPMGAMYFGDQMEDAVSNGRTTVRLSQLLEDRAGYRHLEKLGTKPRVWYLPPADRNYSPPSMARASREEHPRPAPVEAT